eukprot:4834206-Pyramimonas_sp.AAC.1
MKITKCKLCHQKGHWSRECPNAQGREGGPRQGMSAYAFAGATDLHDEKMVTPEALSILNETEHEIKCEATFLTSKATQGLAGPGAGSDLVGAQALNRASTALAELGTQRVEVPSKHRTARAARGVGGSARVISA